VPDDRRTSKGPKSSVDAITYRAIEHSSIQTLIKNFAAASDQGLANMTDIGAVFEALKAGTDRIFIPRQVLDEIEAWQVLACPSSY